jgi:hypothetical protein
VLLDKLGHARSLGVEGNHNALHGLRGIVDRAKNGCEITLNQRKSGGDQIKGGEGMDSLRYRQETMGGTLNHLGVPWSHPNRRLERVGEEKKESTMARNQSKGFIPRGPDLSGGTPDRTCPVRTQFPEKDNLEQLV